MTNYNERLDKVLFSFADYIKHHQKTGLGGVGMTQYDAKQALLDWHNKQVEEVLDRLDKQGVLYETRTPDDHKRDFHKRDLILLSAVEAERNRLKGGNERLRSLGITKEQIDAVEYFGDPPKKLKERDDE